MKCLIVTMPDGSKWAVPVEVIARNRAAEYAEEFGGDVERSLREDTLPLFEESEYQIKDWAAGNMDWRDVKEHAFRVAEAEPMSDDDWQEGWMNGGKKVQEAVRSGFREGRLA